MSKILNRDELNSEFAQLIVDGMDMDALVTYAIEQLTKAYAALSDEEMILEMTTFCPELLEDMIVGVDND